MENNEPFKFEISLSVLNHLGRHLYRNFITVIGEAISNAWDADANNVWIYIDKDNNNFVIKDDGEGMTSDDFQGKFLKIGYSKRKENGIISPHKRPYIGAKGIGKLALLSCAEKISIASKTKETEYVGGAINNISLTKAIERDLIPDEYPLGELDLKLFSLYTENHEKGTIIYFEKTKEDIKSTISQLKKLIALYFRFSLIDDNFNIFINDEKVTLEDIKGLSESTEFLWNINKLKDPYIETLNKLENNSIEMISEMAIKGFIATVEKPRNLKITGTEEKVGVDLFVNGRLREKDILKHLPDFSTRFIASYLYGQIHFNELDANDGVDRFTSSREGIVPGDEKYNELLKLLKDDILERISDSWDALRLARGKDGDDENPRKSLKERRSSSLYNLSSEDYKTEDDQEINTWIKELQSDAEFNIPTYVDCFLSENLVRRHVKEKGVDLESLRSTINRWRDIETSQKRSGNLSIDIRESNDDLFYLAMEELVKLADRPKDGFPDTLLTDEKVFTPIRNAVMHTAKLTNEAKLRLVTVYDNIKGKIKKILTS